MKSARCLRQCYSLVGQNQALEHSGVVGKGWVLWFVYSLFKMLSRCAFLILIGTFPESSIWVEAVSLVGSFGKLWSERRKGRQRDEGNWEKVCFWLGSAFKSPHSGTRELGYLHKDCSHSVVSGCRGLRIHFLALPACPGCNAQGKRNRCWLHSHSISPAEWVRHQQCPLQGSLLFLRLCKKTFHFEEY